MTTRKLSTAARGRLVRELNCSFGPIEALIAEWDEKLLYDATCMVVLGLLDRPKTPDFAWAWDGVLDEEPASWDLLIRSVEKTLGLR